MIAVMQGQTQVWLPAGIKLLARNKDVPFAFDVQVCVCHGYTWVRTEETGRLNIIRWSD